MSKCQKFIGFGMGISICLGCIFVPLPFGKWHHINSAEVLSSNDAVYVIIEEYTVSRHLTVLQFAMGIFGIYPGNQVISDSPEIEVLSYRKGAGPVQATVARPEILGPSFGGPDGEAVHLTSGDSIAWNGRNFYTAPPELAAKLLEQLSHGVNVSDGWHLVNSIDAILFTSDAGIKTLKYAVEGKAIEIKFVTLPRPSPNVRAGRRIEFLVDNKQAFGTAEW